MFCHRQKNNLLDFQKQRYIGILCSKERETERERKRKRKRKKKRKRERENKSARDYFSKPSGQKKNPQATQYMKEWYNM
jgi:hypothetical protein